MEEKRRLPSWMVSASTTNKVIKTLDADTSSVITSDELNIMTKSTKPKAKGVTSNRNKDNLLVKCETKKKKRRVVEKDVIECRDPGQRVNVEKRKRERVKRKAEEPDTSRKKDKKSYEFDSGDETQTLSCDEEDDDDLTMDDILSIAKEFVENDKKDTGQQKSSQVQREPRSESSYARSPMHEEKDSHHESVATTSTVTLADSIMTGDPAQDMLDLFLGPLLKKPIVKDDVTSSVTDVIIPHEIKNQQHAAVVSNKPVTLTKKKSSFKDAVAMLLDGD